MLSCPPGQPERPGDRFQVESGELNLVPPTNNSGALLDVPPSRQGVIILGDSPKVLAELTVLFVGYIQVQEQGRLIRTATKCRT